MPKLVDGRTVSHLGAEHGQTQLGYAQVTPDATANGVALSAIPAGTVRMVVQCNGGTVRWRADGVAGLSASLGSLLNTGDTITIYGKATIALFKHFLASSTPKLDIQYWG